MKILILGSTGMLGSMVLRYLSTKDLDITAPTRKELDKTDFSKYDYIINCIGIIKQKLDNPSEAIKINSLLPHIISKRAPDSKIIQIATDCVYSGEDGQYSELSLHDALDVYGKTKSLGEVDAKNFYNIRTSIIGPGGTGSLLKWFLDLKDDATVDGYANHYWNGVTTLHFAKLCYLIIKENVEIPRSFHFVPGDTVSKYNLLKIFAKRYLREHIEIEPFETPDTVDRTLSTVHEEVNEKLWKGMGYDTPPTIEEMVNEL